MMRVGDLPGPITMAMRKEVLQGCYIQADETTVHVHGRRRRKARIIRPTCGSLEILTAVSCFRLIGDAPGRSRDRFWGTMPAFCKPADPPVTTTPADQGW